MDEGPATLGVRVTAGPDADPEAVADATLQLRRELLELDVEAVEPAPGGPAPPGTRVADPAALGGLVVTLASSRLLTGIVAAIRTWLAGHQQRSISLQVDGDVLELTGLSSAEQTRLADEWLARHARD